MESKKHKITNIQWPTDLYDRIEVVARSQNMTFSKCVRVLCQTALVLLDPTEEESAKVDEFMQELNDGEQGQE